MKQSEPTEFYWKHLRAFHQVAHADIGKILKEDPAFNPYFISEQKERIEMK